jgi:hypothetical protein
MALVRQILWFVSATLLFVDLRSVRAPLTAFLCINVYAAYRPQRFAVENFSSPLTQP